MQQRIVLAMGLSLALGVGGAAAQSPHWDIFDFSRPSAGFFSQPGFDATASTARADDGGPSGDRPVVTIAAPATQPSMGFNIFAMAPASTGSASSGLDSFFDPVERVWVTYDPNLLSEGRRAHNPIPREEVAYSGPERAGTIVISTEERRLYLVLGNGRALRYGIGVGRDGFTWRGEKTVTRMAEWPDWRPPEQMLRRRPDLPRFMPGGVANPLGARALYLGSSLYRIHGSNEPHTIGQAVSSGCFRMTNDDVTDLYTRVRVGARVVVR